ncbi:MAG: 16S rRNA (guanine(527)-N(7))-methyltransferase RsmG [Sedimenticola sp.]|jgi:16S rRNA (guanine527-N7)-methyltransferase|nr:MAG: 16S rRNA (guanine(527)-N(7))-methyltransferase RsmG [Sedimenticola sp.]
MQTEAPIPLWKEQLADGLDAMGIALSDKQQQKALDYLALLLKWNKAFNLTAIRDPQQMVERQLLDSYSILGLIKGKTVLDVGTGPGLPGIPLAIALPDVRFTLLDSNGKKTRFVQQSVHELGLANVEVVRGRVEEFRPEYPFDTVTARAFAPLPRMEQLTARLIADGGQLLAMKGTVPEDEIRAVEQSGYAIQVEKLYVPETDGQRHAIRLQRL